MKIYGFYDLISKSKTSAFTAHSTAQANTPQPGLPTVLVL
jgi:hypothetical protein